MADTSRQQLQINSRTRVKEVRIAAGFTELGWLTFLRLTREQAQEILANENPPSSWVTVNFSQKGALLAELNSKLDQQGLPRVTETVYHWRMGQALAPQIRQSSKSKQDNDELAEAAKDPVASLSSARVEGDSIVLPPIRNQPDLARHLDQGVQQRPATEDNENQLERD